VFRVQERWRCLIGPLAAAFAAVLGVWSGFTLSSPGSHRAVAQQGWLARDRPPIGFEINEGQTDQRVRFLARGRGFTLFLTSDAATLRLREPASAGSLARGDAPRKAGGAKARRADPALSLRLAGASPAPHV